MRNDLPRVIVDDDDHDHVVNLHGRPFRRAAVIAAVIACVVGISVGPARAEPSSVVVGMATMTSQVACPDGLKVDLTIVELDDDSWSLTAQPVHADCTVRTDLPLRFEGDWDETGAEPCNLHTGARCFIGIDRPGRLALGGAPAVRALMEVPITYARGPFRMEGTALIYRVAS